jgi:PAS domain S-box-containing protein
MTGRAPLDDVLMTAELDRRPARQPDYAAESRALAALAETLAAEPRGLLQKLVDLVLELCRADSAGVSILEPGDPEVFRWHAIAGRFAINLHGTMPRSASPCGVVLDRDAALLFGHPERHFDSQVAVDPPVVEMLLIPFHVGGKPVGTVWAIAHTEARKFDAEDARLLTGLSRFASAAHQTTAALDAAEAGQTELERQVEERTRELELANAALRDSRAFHELVAGLGSDWWFSARVDPDGAVVTEVLTDGFTRQLGYTKDELMAAGGWRAVVHPDELAGAERQMARLLAGETIDGEMRHVARDGRVVWYQYRTRPEADAAGRVVRLYGASRDVSDRKRAEEALRASEEQCRVIAQAIPGVVFTVRPDGWTDYVNDWFYQFTGLPPGSAEGRGWEAVLHPDDRAEAARATERLRDGVADDNRYRFRAADGSYHWFLSRARPLHDADGRLLKWVGVAIDIDDLVRTQDALARVEERFRLLVENVKDYAIYLMDTDGRVMSWNQGAERQLGYGSEEILGTSGSRFFTPEDRAKALPSRELRTAADTGRASDENWMVRKDGTRFWASGVTTALRDDPGSLLGFVKIFRDLTDQRAAEAAVQDSRERLRLALDAARMGIWTWDVAANVHTRDRNLNRLLGLPPSETKLPLEEFLRHVHPDDRDVVWEAFTTSVREGRNLNTEFRVVWPDGTVRWLRDQGDVFGGPDTGSLRMTGACVDVTDRKEAEEKLRRAHDELETRVRQRTAELAETVEALQREMAERKQAQESRRELLGRMVTAQEEDRRRIARELHDSLGQYLAAMSIGLKTAREKDGPGRDRLEPLAELTKEIGREVHRIALELRPTALDDLSLRATLQLYVETWSERSHITAEYVSRGLDAERFTWQVSTTVYRAVQESLTNVLRHAGATRVSVIVERRPDHLYLIVEDDGKGFDPDRVPDTVRETGGLGLLGMRERVALVGGTLQVESSPGGGTTVYLRVPVPEAGGRDG